MIRIILGFLKWSFYYHLIFQYVKTQLLKIINKLQKTATWHVWLQLTNPTVTFLGITKAYWYLPTSSMASLISSGAFSTWSFKLFQGVSKFAWVIFHEIAMWFHQTITYERWSSLTPTYIIGHWIFVLATLVSGGTSILCGFTKSVVMKDGPL